MRVLIIEDEFLLAEELAERLVEIDDKITIVGKLSSIAEAVAWFATNSCDLLFLDIHLNDGLSFSIFEKIELNCPVIFTTAYDEYAIKAFDVNSIAYLLKPIADEDLQRALQKYGHLQIERQDDALQNLLTYIAKQEHTYIERLMVTIGKVQKPITVNEVAYFMAEDRFVFAITKEGKKYFYQMPLYQLEEELNPKDFLRVNRGFIVSYESIDEILTHTKGRVLLKLKPATKQEVVVSSEKAKELKEWLSQ